LHISLTVQQPTHIYLRIKPSFGQQIQVVNKLCRKYWWTNKV